MSEKIQMIPVRPDRKNWPNVFVSGAVIGTLGGLIGLGGAEFRLPLLIGLFGFGSLEAVVLNKVMSMIVVASALPFRAGTVPIMQLIEHWPVILNLLAGSLLGAWAGASWATRLRSETLYRIIAVLLLTIALVLAFGHQSSSIHQPILTGSALVIAGVAAGLGIGVVASLLGVAGGELLVPTLMLLFGADIKLAGSLSLFISLPTMLTGIARYSKDQRFITVKHYRDFVLIMATGSLLGSYVGGQLVGIVSAGPLLSLLSLILLISAVKVWRHAKPDETQRTL
ncbi:sulfite exporter TauE/SafE family protein [Methylomonas sp. MgM2]